MPNRYHSTINDKLSAPKPPANKAGGKASYSGESTHNWVTNTGPAGPNRNKVGFKKVKQSAKTTI